MLEMVRFRAKNRAIGIGNRMGPSKIKDLISLVFSEVAEIALVAARLGQFQQLLKTQVILILNFTRIHCDYLLITKRAKLLNF